MNPKFEALTQVHLQIHSVLDSLVSERDVPRVIERLRTLALHYQECGLIDESEFIYTHAYNLDRSRRGLPTRKAP
jgi:hypothetical protein